MKSCVIANSVWRWPEWIALCERLEIPLDFANRDISIRLSMDCEVVVNHTYIGRDATAEDHPLDPQFVDGIDVRHR
jgi:hypothetical protein